MMIKTRLIHVSVTEEDIKRGERHSLIRCPVYLAMRRVCPRMRFAVNSIKILRGNYLCSHHNDYRDVPWPREVRRFIDRFDSGEKVTPIEFDMYIKI
jgi:hypothetical protein